MINSQHCGGSRRNHTDIVSTPPRSAVYSSRCRASGWSRRVQWCVVIRRARLNTAGGTPDRLRGTTWWTLQQCATDRGNFSLKQRTQCRHGKRAGCTAMHAVRIRSGQLNTRLYNISSTEDIMIFMPVLQAACSKLCMPEQYSCKRYFIRKWQDMAYNIHEDNTYVNKHQGSVAQTQLTVQC